VACLSNLKQWGLYFSMYTGDNNDYFQHGWWSGQDYRGTSVAVLRPYYEGSEDLLCCPTATRPVTELGTHPFAAWGTYTADQRPCFAGLCGSYGINAWVRNPPFEMSQTNAERPTKNNWRTPMSGAPTACHCCTLNLYRRPSASARGQEKERTCRFSPGLVSYLSPFGAPMTGRKRTKARIVEDDLGIVAPRRVPTK